MFAAIGSVPYNIMLFVHIITAMIGFAPVLVHPLLGRQTSDTDGPGRSAVFGFMARNTMRIYSSALIVSGLIGFGVAGLSDKVYRVRQPWLIVAVLLWIAMIGVIHGGLVKSEKAIAAAGPDRNEAAEARHAKAGAIFTALFVGQILLMVFKPGI